MGNIEFYDDLASKESWFLNNGRFFGFHFFTEKNIFRDIMKKLDFQKNDSVLDLGSGTGRIARYIAPYCREIVLADGAPNALKAAKRKLSGAKNARFALVDLNSAPLPFQNDEFDKVLCYSVIHASISNHEKAGVLIRELLRIAKPGGRILIGDIPLQEKYATYLGERKRHRVKNFLLDQRYYGKKLLTAAFYRIRKIDEKQAEGLVFTRDVVRELLDGERGIVFEFYTQDRRLPFANSREDLFIKRLG
jgi:ubiquinone/menaquinone biosynthesis C-methylase UbiE